MKKINKSNCIMIIVTFIFLSVFSLALTIGSQTTARWLVVLAQTDESLTITTYYPSPSGSYLELQTQVLHFQENMAGNGLISFNYPDAVYDKRLRITAGAIDNGNNDQGASIDLHGNNMAVGTAGNLDLVAGSGGDIRFFVSQPAIPAIPAEETMTITTSGNVGIGMTSPQASLHVAGAYGVKIGDELLTPLGTAALAVTDADEPSGVYVGQDGSTRFGGLTWVYNATPANAYMELSTYGTNPLTLQTSGSGSVGIGTTAPGEKLEVAGNIKLSGTLIGGSSNSAVQGLTNGQKYVNNGMRKLIVVAFGPASGGGCSISGWVNNILVAGDSGINERKSITFVVPVGAQYKVDLTCGVLYATAWEM